MTDVRAVSLWQPWASLVALGVKRIETRSWATRYRGRLLTHAAKRRPEYEGLPLGWGAKVCYHKGCDEAGEFVYPLGDPEKRMMLPLPFGAVVASCVLTDCVPILARDGTETTERFVRHTVTDDWNMEEWPDGEPLLALRVAPGDYRIVEDQRPFGDFTPGRFAWLLTDVKPTTERCPRCWGHAVTSIATMAAVADEQIKCRTCRGAGVCEPVPLRGRQGLWSPRWDEVAA